MHFVHLAARSFKAAIPISSDAVGFWLWPRLRQAFPTALAAVLMPDHVHLVVPGDVDDLATRLARVLGNCARGPSPVSSVRWMPCDDPGSFTGALKLARNVRYVALNPVRAGLTSDPLSWVWSTHREVLGAVADPWVSAEKLARALGWTPARVERCWHDYVTRDGGVLPSAPPSPFVPASDSFGEAPMSWIMGAAAAATRRRLVDVATHGPARALFLALAKRAGWRSTAMVAEKCALTPRSVRRAWAGTEPASVGAGLLCLGDARLRGGASEKRTNEGASPPL